MSHSIEVPYWKVLAFGVAIIVAAVLTSRYYAHQVDERSYARGVESCQRGNTTVREPANKLASSLRYFFIGVINEDETTLDIRRLARTVRSDAKTLEEATVDQPCFEVVQQP